MIDGIQKITSYIVGDKKTEVFETLQYNKNCNAWYVVGDCSTNRELVQVMIDNNNLRLKSKMRQDKGVSNK